VVLLWFAFRAPNGRKLDNTIQHNHLRSVGLLWFLFAAHKLHTSPGDQANSDAASGIFFTAQVTLRLDWQ
jgi:hypothetical protein